MLETLAGPLPDYAYISDSISPVFIHNLIVVPNMNCVRSEVKSNHTVDSSKDIITHFISLQDQSASHNIRGRRWNSVILVGISIGMLRNEYPDIYMAIENSCISLNTKVIEV